MLSSVARSLLPSSCRVSPRAPLSLLSSSLPAASRCLRSSSTVYARHFGSSYADAPRTPVQQFANVAGGENGDFSSFSTTDDVYSQAGTKCVQSGEAGGRVSMQDCLTTPIAQTSAYTFRDTQQLIDFCEKRLDSYEYGRYGNPTTKVLEDKLKALENAEDCLFSTSGMCSCTTMFMALVPKGGKVLTTKDCYRRTRQFITTFLPRMDITTEVLDLDKMDTKAICEKIKQAKASLFFSESPTNPYLRCIDIPAIGAACKQAGTVLAIDSTFATPINQKPLELGADLVVHSATKYIAGHNDVLAGAIAGSRELVQKIRVLHHVLGGVIDPHASYLVLRGMKTLAVRMKRHNENGLQLATFLRSMPQIEKVFYPALPNHPDYDIARRQMTGFGGVVSFIIKGGLKPASAFVDALKIPYIAPSLGGVESLVEQPTIISYWDKSPQERKDIGIEDGLIRFSCGVEDPADLMADVAQALRKAPIPV